MTKEKSIHSKRSIQAKKVAKVTPEAATDKTLKAPSLSTNRLTKALTSNLDRPPEAMVAET